MRVLTIYIITNLLPVIYLPGMDITYQGDHFVSYYPPGYPLILAGIFGISKLLSISENTLLVIFQVLLTALSVVFIFHLAKRISTTNSALIVAFLWMTYPFQLWLTKQPNSEIPFMAFLYGGCTIFFTASCIQNQRKFPYLISGLLIGSAILIRPIAVFFPFMLGASLIFFLSSGSIKKKFVLFIIFMCGVLTPIIPWEAIVYAKTGKVVLISENSSMALRGGLVFAIADDDYKQAVPVPSDVHSLMSEIKDHYADLDSNYKIFSFLADKLKKTPLPVIRLIGIKALRSWYATDRQSYETVIALLQLPYLGLVIYGLFLAWKRGGSSRNLAVGIWMLTVCNWAMTILVTSTLRYMVPIIGLLFINLAQVPFSIFKKMESKSYSTTSLISK